MSTQSSNQVIRPNRYPGGLLILHWLIAVLLLSMIMLGLYMGSLPRGDALKALLLNWHLMTGLIVLVLALLRLRIRSRQAIPALPDAYRRWRKWLVRSVHFGFYCLMFGLPVLGLSVWALDPFVGGPALLGQGVWVSTIAGWLHRLHYLGAWLLLALLVLHIAGALGVDDQRRRIIRRMLPVVGSNQK